MKKIIKFFDHVEDRIRASFSHTPIIYAFIGGVLIVLFWRAVWQTGDILEGRGGIIGFLFYEPISLIWTTLVMLLIGIFVSYFIGDQILMSGLKHEEKLSAKTEKEIREEETQINKIEKVVEKIEEEILEMKEEIKNK